MFSIMSAMSYMYRKIMCSCLFSDIDDACYPVSDKWSTHEGTADGQNS